MAWRIHQNLVEGEMDNTTPGRISGTMRFVGMAGEVTLDLAGDFKGELRGKRIRMKNPAPSERTPRSPDGYMSGFWRTQSGAADSVEVLSDGMLHAAWYSDKNGRVVLELPADAWSVEDETAR